MQDSRKLLSMSHFLLFIVITALIFSGLSAGIFALNSGHNGKTGSASKAYTSPSFHVAGQNGYQVNPYAGYSREAAPMGVTDFGYSSAGSYSYNTTSFIGKANMTDFYTYNSSLTQNKNGSSLQLNLNLQFTANGQTYTYWVQDVAQIFSGTGGPNHYVALIDNLWNFSSSGANLQTSGISGNGSLSTFTSQGQTYTFYYDYATGLPGNNVTLPGNFSLQMKATSVLTQSGIPEVIMSYNDGYGWQTYDNLFFNFAKGASKDSGFVVNGNTYNPAGAFYDAELILGGPGGGSSTILQSGSASLSLQYWNGHNYNNPRNEYNFGGDTGESISNVIASGKNYVSSASYNSVLTAGSGSLAQIYSQSQSGIFNLSLPDENGTVQMNNVTYQYTGYDLNLTLYGGEYNVSIPLSSGGVLKGIVIITAGSYDAVNYSYFSTKYTVNITETGLPPGSNWSLTFTNGTIVSSNSTQISTFLSNGTYTVNLTGPVGYEYVPESLQFNVNGNNITVNAYFNRTYSVIFIQAGLNGLDWSVTLNGNQVNSVSSNITFVLPNGTYNYTVQDVQGYTVSPSYGNVTVNGSYDVVQVAYSPYLIKVTMNETGLPANVTWRVYIENSWHYSNSTTLVLFLQNGSYTYTAEGDNGSYVLKGSNGTFLINGSTSTINLTLVPKYNGGIYFMQKIISLALLISVIAIGSMAIRRIGR